MKQILELNINNIYHILEKKIQPGTVTVEENKNPAGHW